MFLKEKISIDRANFKPQNLHDFDDIAQNYDLRLDVIIMDRCLRQIRKRKGQEGGIIIRMKKAAEHSEMCYVLQLF